MRVYLFVASIAMLCGCADHIATLPNCTTFAGGERRPCIAQGSQQDVVKPDAESSEARRKAANARAGAEGGVAITDAAAGVAPAASGEPIPPGSLEAFKMCLTIGQTPFDQFSCLKDLKKASSVQDRATN